MDEPLERLARFEKHSFPRFEPVYRQCVSGGLHPSTFIGGPDSRLVISTRAAAAVPAAVSMRRFSCSVGRNRREAASNTRTRPSSDAQARADLRTAAGR